jgi:plastocyanin
MTTVASNTRAWSWHLTLVAAALALLVSGWMMSRAGGVAAGGRPPKTHTVTIEGTSFRPDRLSVAVGDTVVWVNKDPFPHTATATGTFDSGGIDPEKSWKFLPAKKGTFDYVCTFHPTMKARLSVE